MTDYLGKIVTVILAFIACFLLPLYFSAQQSDNVTQSVVYSVTSDFVNQVEEQGYISQEMYMQFVQGLDNTNLLYDIEMNHSHQNVVPVFDGNGQVVDTEKVEDVMYTEQILEVLYAEEKTQEELDAGASQGIYHFSKGDTFSVTVKNRENTSSQTMSLALFRNVHQGSAIYVQCGGIIRDENF